MQQKNFKQRGSTLVIVMIVMMVLTLLGTTILSLAYSNYKMKKINSQDIASFYLAEAGLEEAYAMIGNMVDDAIEKGNEEVVKVYTEEFIRNYIEYDEDNDKEYIDEDRLLTDQNLTFKNTYKNYLPVELEKTLENMNYYVLNSYGEGTPQITIKNDKKSFVFENDKLIISLRSTYTKNHIKKSLDATYEISVPEYQGQYYLTTYVKNIPHNIIWTKSMAIDGDLVVKEGEIEINGDVYVKGREDKGTSREKYTEYENMINRLGDDDLEDEEFVSVATQVNFDALPSRKLDGINNEFILLNPSSSKDYAIVGDNGNTSNIPKGVTKIYLSYPDVKGVIITKGKLYLTGEINFMGTMIVKEDVIIDDGKAINIYHDKHYVARMIHEHSDWLGKVFRNNSKNQTIPVITEVSVDSPENQSVQIRDGLIKLTNWAIAYE